MQALLAQLRASQALQAAIGTPAPAESNDSGSSQVPDNLPHPPIEPADAVDEQANGASATSERPSVASLLSQLQSSSAIQAALAVEFPAVQGLPVTVNTAYAPQPSAQPTDPRLRGRTHSESAAHKQDLRNASFQQALPGIAQLSEDQAFVDAVRKVRQVISCLHAGLFVYLFNLSSRVIKFCLRSACGKSDRRSRRDMKRG